MAVLKKVFLKRGKDQALARRHPWVFSGAIARTEGNPTNGDLVNVFSAEGKPLATGFFSLGSIAIRLVAFDAIEPNPAFWQDILAKAVNYRKLLGLLNNKQTNVFRLFNAEGDGIPGLVIDYYNGVAVMQCHTEGTYLIRPILVQALQNLLGKQLTAVYDKSVEALNIKGKNDYLFAAEKPTLPHTVTENGHSFLVDWETGQKTGFFIDQRNNRQVLSQYTAGKKVLNTFCYTGGFSVYAGQNAALVHSVDSSAKAVALADQNIALNNPKAPHQSYVADVFEFFRDSTERYDVMVLDPPAFAKNLHARHNALMAYKRLNAEAFKRIAPSGIVFTFSCSGVVDRNLFEGAVLAGAIEANRNVKIIAQLGPPQCHPVNIFHPEGNYLKGLILYVE